MPQMKVVAVEKLYTDWNCHNPAVSGKKALESRSSRLYGSIKLHEPEMHSERAMTGATLHAGKCMMMKADE